MKIKNFTIIMIILLYGYGYAEVSLDGTMGTIGNIKGPDYDIKQAYGLTKGANLFHSFEKFNINTNETANFSVANSIRNIVSRITNGEQSLIDGKIRSIIQDTTTISNANLYLLNPAGIIFGPNASLDIGGSFYAATADYLKMGNDRFYVKDENPILSSEDPVAFGFLVNNVKSITFQGNGKIDSSEACGLIAKDGQNISIVAGGIDIKGTYYYDPIENKNKALGNISAPQGRINLASVKSPGEAVINNSGIDVSNFRTLGDITLSDYANLKVSGEGSGNICIRGDNFYMKGNSSIEADTTGNKNGGIVDIKTSNISIDSSDIFSDTKGTGNGGDIKFEALRQTEISNFSYVYANATGVGSNNSKGGKITIESLKIALKDKAKVYSETYGKSQGGQVTLKGDDISVYDSEIFAGTEDEGNAGSVNIMGSNIAVSNNSIISSDTYYGKGRGGDVTISGKDFLYANLIDVFDSASIYSGAIKGEFKDASGGGTVALKARNINFRNGGKIGSESEGGGRGGNVIVEASESVNFYGEDNSGNVSKAYTTSKSTASYAGNAGDITIKTPKVVFKNKGGITASTNGPGKAGEIVLETNELLLNDRGSITSKSDSTTSGGNAGKISIKAVDKTQMQNNSFISTSTEGMGNAGTINIKTGDLTVDSYSFITSKSNNTQAGGNAGSISVQSDKDIKITNRGYISTSTEGKGSAGNINLNCSVLNMDNEGSISSGSSSTTGGGPAGWINIFSSDKILLSNNSSIGTEAINTSSSKQNDDRLNGRISIKTIDKLYLSNSKITTSVKSGDGNGGDIEIDPRFVILYYSKIIANAYEGNGGNIHIVTDQFVKDAYSIVDASSQFGLAGNIKIEAPNVDVSSALVALPTNFLDAAKWMKTPCYARTNENASRFIFANKDGMPMSHYDLQASPIFFMYGTDLLADNKEDEITEKPLLANRRNYNIFLSDCECNETKGMN